MKQTTDLYFVLAADVVHKAWLRLMKWLQHVVIFRLTFCFCSFNKLNYSRQQKMIYSYQFAPHPLHHTNKHVHCSTDSGSSLAFTCHDTVCWRLLLILSTNIQSILFSWLFFCAQTCIIQQLICEHGRPITYFFRHQAHNT